MGMSTVWPELIADPSSALQQHQISSGLRDYEHIQEGIGHLERGGYDVEVLK